MPFMDTIKDGISRIIPEKRGGRGSSLPLNGGIGNHTGHGMVEDDMIVSKPAIVFHASQIFFNFLTMACYASVTAFQAQWDVGPSGLSGFTLFITIFGMLLSAFMLAVPVIYEKHDKLVQIARALKEARVSFILTGVGTGCSLIIAFIVTISAWTQAGCKNPDNDPNEDKGDDYKKGLEGWCMTKKASAIFLWLAFVFWAASLVLLIINWRQGKLLGPRDPTFVHPNADEEEDDEHEYEVMGGGRRHTMESTGVPDRIGASSNPFTDHDDDNRYSGYSGYDSNVSSQPPQIPTSYSPAPAAGRPSIDAYGAFSDPAPSGYPAVASPSRQPVPPMIPEPDFEPRVSRTMQYADPYAAVRATIAQPPAASEYSTPPSYETGGGYQGYR